MPTCETFIQPLNLECLLINTFSGSVLLFTALAFIFISYMAARFRMPNEISLLMFVIFGVLMAQYLQGVFVLIVLVVGLIIFYSIAKIVKN